MKAALPPGFPHPLNYGQNAPIERPEGGGSEYNAYDEAAAEASPPAPMAYQHSMTMADVPIERPEGGGSEYNAYDEAAAEASSRWYAMGTGPHVAGSDPYSSVSAAMANMTMAPSEPSDHA